MSEPAIRVRGLGKRYRMAGSAARYRTLREDLVGLLRPRRGGGMFTALADVDCDIAAGEIVGIIGGNGAGKSTLLKLLARVVEPTSGEAVLRGRVASLLEIGTGFHPELTGRENIALAGAILGMRRAEIARRFDEIVAFAEVERHLDQPVKRYSSGMYVRLAFAVAAHLDCDILLVDEVLAVGDARFQQRCLQAMGSAAAGGRTVILVSHAMGTVTRLCQRALWLRDGRIAADGPAPAVVSAYLGWAVAGAGIASQLEAARARGEDPAFRWLDLAVRQDGHAGAAIFNGAESRVIVDYEVRQPTAGLRVYVDLLDDAGDILFRSFNDEREPNPTTVAAGRYRSEAIIPPDILADRVYTLVVQATISDVREVAVPLSVRLEVVRSSAVNAAYPHEPIRARLLPPLRWTTERT